VPAAPGITLYPLETLQLDEVPMTTDNHLPQTETSSLSRRTFLQTTLAAAGASALPRIFECRLAGAEPAKDSPKHPLDPLPASEIADVVQILGQAKKLTDSFRFVSIPLDEPAKAVAIAHKPGQPFPRRAFLVLLDNATGTGYETVVDL